MAVAGPDAAGTATAVTPATDRPTREPPIGPAAFAGVAVASLGGPLALAALYVPTLLGDVAGSAGLVTAAGAAAFVLVLLIWLRYARTVHTAGGLYGYVFAAAGRRTALVQGGLWITSYLLYLVYTPAFVVYDLLPQMLPGVRPYQPALELALPLGIAAVLVAGRRVTLAVVGVLAGGQLLLVLLLAGVAFGHRAGGSTFAAPGALGPGALAVGNVALLYVCGSLPLFLGGEVRRPAVTVRRGLSLAYSVVAVAVTGTVVGLAAHPALLRTPVPGYTAARAYAGGAAADAVAVGVAASVVGLIVVEYLALGRLAATLTARSTRTVNVVLAGALVLAAPLSLIDPERFYTILLKPSLVALWLSQLIVVVAYPRFAARRGRLRAGDVLLTAGAATLILYGLYAAVVNQVAS